MRMLVHAPVAPEISAIALAAFATSSSRFALTFLSELASIIAYSALGIVDL